jgi:hypothetical protein
MTQRQKSVLHPSKEHKQLTTSLIQFAIWIQSAAKDHKVACTIIDISNRKIVDISFNSLPTLLDSVKFEQKKFKN